MASYSQEVRIANFSDGDEYVVLDGIPLSDEYSNVKVYFQGNKLEDFIGDLGKKSGKVVKWGEVAKK